MSDDRKVVLLTGAAGQIGTAFCERCSDRYDIVAVYHRQRPTVPSQRRTVLDPFAPDQPAPGPAPVWEVQADLRDGRDVARVVEVALARFGRIDVVVNAVGGWGGRQLLGAGIDALPRLFELNATVPLAVAAGVALEHWRHHDGDNRARNRVVVNLSATAAVDVADSSAGRTFGPAKAALNMLSLHLAEELAPYGVRVATVAPAPVPAVVSVERVVDAVVGAIEGDASASLLLLWDDGEEQL